MAITAQPLGVLPVHIPLIYSVSATIPTVAGEELKQVVITATKVSTGETFTFRQNFDSITSGGGNDTGFADINLSAIGKAFFCSDVKLGAFGVLGSEYNNLNPLSEEDLAVSFTYDKVNTSGILEDIGITDIATDITLLNSVRDICDPQDLDAYVTAASDRCFLTNRPDSYPICFGDNDFLQYWTTGINSFEVKIYPAEGVPPRDQGVFLDSPVITPDSVASVGAGVVNINDISVWEVGAPSILESDLYYTFSAGFYDPILLTYTPVTKEMRFNITSCCDRKKCTLFFLNRLGGVDRYTFDSRKILSNNPSSSFYEKVRDPSLNIKSDYGRQKYDSKDKTVLTLESRILCEDLSSWLLELQTSTRVYKQIGDTDCIAVVIRDSDTVIENFDTPIITKRLTLEYSVDPCIQNNI